MKQQILVVHGGTTFDSYNDYISYLKNRKISLDEFKSKKDWKDGLEKELGENFEVFSPRMPNGTNARYEEWKIWFERIIPLLYNNLIIIGHSLGGIFLAKYLSENDISKKIKATILVAAPFDDVDIEESLGNYILPSSLSKFAEQGGMIHLIHSKDDPVVPFEQLARYKLELPNAKTIIVENSGHFKQETFPEIIELVKNIVC